MKLVYLVVDKLSEWLEGNPYRLAALALVPVGAFVGASIANKEIGYTIYSWGGITLETQSEIYKAASFCWASSSYLFLHAVNSESLVMRLLIFSASYFAAFSIYSATHVAL